MERLNNKNAGLISVVSVPSVANKYGLLGMTHRAKLSSDAKFAVFSVCLIYYPAATFCMW